MNCGDDWMVIGIIGDFGTQDGTRSYCRGRIDRYDNRTIVQVVIDDWTMTFVQSGFDQKGDWTGRSFAYNLVEFGVRLIRRIGGDNLEG